MCYFTFCFRLHKVVTAICLTHLNCHYSDVLGDDTLGCTQCCLPSLLLNNKIFLTRDSNTAVILLKAYRSLFSFRDIHKLLTHNIPPFVSLISAFYLPFSALEASLWESLFSSLTWNPFFCWVFFFSVGDFFPVQLLTVVLFSPLASDKGNRNWQGLFVMGMRQGWHTLDYKMQRRAEVR